MGDPFIHYSADAILGLPLTMTSWRVGACGARVDKWFTQAGEGEGELTSVTCGNCKRTKVYKAALEIEGEAGEVGYAQERIEG